MSAFDSYMYASVRRLLLAVCRGRMAAFRRAQQEYDASYSDPVLCELLWMALRQAKFAQMELVKLRAYKANHNTGKGEVTK